MSQGMLIPRPLLRQYIDGAMDEDEAIVLKVASTILHNFYDYSCDVRNVKSLVV